jgi:hypothetical protein
MITTNVVTRLPAGRPLRRARVGVALTFLVTGLVFGTWAARLPAIKHALELSEGGLGVVFMGLNVGAVLGLQLGGALVPRSGSRAALRLALPAYVVALAGPALAGDLATLRRTVPPGRREQRGRRGHERPRRDGGAAAGTAGHVRCPRHVQPGRAGRGGRAGQDPPTSC